MLGFVEDQECRWHWGHPPKQPPKSLCCTEANKLHLDACSFLLEWFGVGLDFVRYSAERPRRGPSAASLQGGPDGTLPAGIQCPSLTAGTQSPIASAHPIGAHCVCLKSSCSKGNAFYHQSHSLQHEANQSQSSCSCLVLTSA